jgi:integrase
MGGCPLFLDAKNIKPAFPVYLLAARNDGRPKQLAPATMKKACEYARDFLTWCAREQPVKYKGLSVAWIDTIRPARSRGMQTELKAHEYYTLEDMLKIAAIDAPDLKLKRDRAAACFLFLSGMRADAFCTMPISCVDLKAGRVSQVPASGVRTKNRKAAITTLLQIPILIAIVQEWDGIVRALPHNVNWYTKITNDKARFTGIRSESRGSVMLLERGIKAICEAAGVRYLSPHKFRHGHAIYGISRVKDIKGLKALSQNLMHSSVSITDGIYGNLVEDDIYLEISQLAVSTEKPAGAPDLASQVSQLLEFLQRKQAAG